MALIFLSLLVVSAACSGAAEHDKFDSRIVNGKDAKPGEIPYQVSLQEKEDNFHFCGGSVLNENYIITAAHCVKRQMAQNIKVVVGTIDLNKPHTERNVTKIIYHDRFNPYEGWVNDIAVLKLEAPIHETEQISFVTLPSGDDGIQENDVAVVSGWGKLWQGGPVTTSLKRVDILVVTREYCKEVYKRSFYDIHESQICAFNPSEGKGSCQGDSGGPMTIKGKLVGLVSWGKGCASTNYPTVFTRVSSYLDWIKEKTSEQADICDCRICRICNCRIA